MSTEAFRQTGAILMDAYREMNARKMFWVVLILSLLAVVLFGLFGVNENGRTFLWYQMTLEPGVQGELEYKRQFSNWVVGFYLTWIATILALISTASIFPDFMTGGAIDVYLSKPIRRTRLFMTKYVSGLIFVAMQVTVFSVASFLVLGFRGHTWQPGLFLAIPIVVVFFSYLYGICVLLGVMTRSTIAALMLTLLAWFGIAAIDFADQALTQVTIMAPSRKMAAEREVARLDRQISQLESSHSNGANTLPTATAPDTQPTSTMSAREAADLSYLRARRQNLKSFADAPPVPPWVGTAQKVVVGLKTFVPKTRETTALLDRYLLPDWEIAKAAEEAEKEQTRDEEMRHVDPTRGRSVWWIVGTSLAFEAACFGLAAWIFQRRDY